MTKSVFMFSVVFLTIVPTLGAASKCETLFESRSELAVDHGKSFLQALTREAAQAFKEAKFKELQSDSRGSALHYTELSGHTTEYSTARLKYRLVLEDAAATKDLEVLQAWLEPGRTDFSRLSRPFYEGVLRVAVTEAEAKLVLSQLSLGDRRAVAEVFDALHSYKFILVIDQARELEVYANVADPNALIVLKQDSQFRFLKSVESDLRL